MKIQLKQKNEKTNLWFKKIKSTIIIKLFLISVSKDLIYDIQLFKFYIAISNFIIGETCFLVVCVIGFFLSSLFIILKLNSRNKIMLKIC